MKKGIIWLLIAALLTVPVLAGSATVQYGTVGGTATYAVVDPTGLELTALVANDSVHTDEKQENMIASAGGKVVAAINGGFFNSFYKQNEPVTVSSGNYPRAYNCIVRDGQLVLGGFNQYAIGQTYDGRLLIDSIYLRPVVTIADRPCSCWAVNVFYPDADAEFLLTEQMDYPLDISPFARLIHIQNGTVTYVEGGHTGVRCADGEMIYVCNNGGRQAERGDAVEFTFRVEPTKTENTEDWNRMRTIVGGGGQLVMNGVNVVEQNRAAAEDQNADQISTRTFVAQTYDGKILMGVVTGTFRKMADDLIAMGVKDAINMDGGASCMLYANGAFQVKAGWELATAMAFIPSGSAAAAVDAPSVWAADRVEQARAKKLLPKSLDCRYQAAITRMEFCRLIEAFFAVKTGSTLQEYCERQDIPLRYNVFSDCTDDAVAGVAALGIVTGYPDGTFRPNDSIKRQDAAIILQRMALLLGSGQAGAASVFLDEAQISPYAKPGVDFVSALGIMNGNADGTFSPMTNITREQAVITMINADRAL